MASRMRSATFWKRSRSQRRCVHRHPAISSINWLPHYRAGNRSYMTVAIGCTGGQHRSVYLAESPVPALQREQYPGIHLRHRELQ